jgi:hypothetical protein
MAGGRPRTQIPTPEEMIKLGEEMVQWVEIHRPLHLTQWWKIEKFITSKVWECMQVAPEFFPYYEKALSIIGLQYLDKESRIRDGISQRWQRVYFKDLRDQEDADARFQASLKSEVVTDQVSLAELSRVMAAALSTQTTNHSSESERNSNNTDKTS